MKAASCLMGKRDHKSISQVKHQMIQQYDIFMISAEIMWLNLKNGRFTNKYVMA